MDGKVAKDERSMREEWGAIKAYREFAQAADVLVQDVPASAVGSHSNARAGFGHGEVWSGLIGVPSTCKEQRELWHG